MRHNKDFSIAFKGLKIGTHNFKYKIGISFFKYFETSPVKAGDLEANLVFNKRRDHFQLDFDISGTIASNCDRCTANIDLPIQQTGSFVVKFSEEEKEEEEIIFIDNNAQFIQVDHMIYELIILGVPLIKVFDCDSLEPFPCNEEILDYLYQDEEDDVKPDDQQKSNPIWDQLNDLKFKDN